MKKNFFLIVLSFPLLSACTSTVQISPSSMPAGAVMANRVIKAETTYSFSNDMAERGVEFQCAAFSFRTNFGKPVEETLAKATHAGFANASLGAADIRTPYNIRFDIDDIEGHTSIIPGFWSSSVEAHVELSGTVDVTDANGTEVAKAEIVGSGSAASPGACPAAESAIQKAGEKALRKLGEDYVYKIINTNVLH